MGAHFKALIKAILVPPLKSFKRFFRISSSPVGLWIIFLHFEVNSDGIQVHKKLAHIYRKVPCNLPSVCSPRILATESFHQSSRSMRQPVSCYLHTTKYTKKPRGTAKVSPREEFNSKEVSLKVVKSTFSKLFCKGNPFRKLGSNSPSG